KRVDSPADGVLGLGHGLVLDGGERRWLHRQQVSRIFAGGRSDTPVGETRIDQIAESSCGVGSQVMNQDLRVVYLAKVVVVDVLIAQLGGQVVEGLIGILADGLVHLNLQDQVRAALQVQAQLDALAEVIAQRGGGRGEGRQAQEPVGTEQNHAKNENS